MLHQVTQEKLFKETKDLISESITDRKKNYIVGISGINCAGKSTLAQSLACETFGFSNSTHAFDIDDFLHERKVRNANPNQVAGCYESFDYETLFQDILKPARDMMCIKKSIRALNVANDVYEDRIIHIEGPCMIIAEGIFLYRKDLSNVFDLKIWLEIEEKEIVRRALTRSRELSKHPNPESIMARYEDRFIPAQKYHLEHDRPRGRCDVVFEIQKFA